MPIPAYEVVVAKTVEEALKIAIWKVGDPAVCAEVKVIANGNDSWTVIAEFDRPEPDGGTYGEEG